MEDLEGGPGFPVTALGDVKKTWDTFKFLQVQKIAVHRLVVKSYQLDLQDTSLKNVLVHTLAMWWPWKIHLI